MLQQNTHLRLRLLNQHNSFENFTTSSQTFNPQTADNSNKLKDKPQLRFKSIEAGSRRRKRTKFSLGKLFCDYYRKDNFCDITDQLSVLESAFLKVHYPPINIREEIASKTSLTEARVQVRLR